MDIKSIIRNVETKINKDKSLNNILNTDSPNFIKECELKEHNSKYYLTNFCLENDLLLSKEDANKCLSAIDKILKNKIERKKKIKEVLK